MVRSVLNNIIFSYKAPTVDNFIFRLLYRWTVWKLLVFSFIVTCRLVLGDSFSCDTPYDAVPKSFLDAKCYSEPVFAYPMRSSRDLDIYPSGRTFQSNDYKREQSFYPWVNLAFLAQALAFHLPHLLWKAYESGYVGRLTAGLQVALSKEQKRSIELCCLAKFFSITQGKHKVFTLVYIFCEICNFAVAVSHTVWLVNFFDVTGVPDYVSVDISSWAGYRNFYFPSTGTCTFTNYSPSGDSRTLEATCVLSLNHLYMKMFLILRAWYIFLVLATGAVVIYRIVLILPMVRCLVIRAYAPLASKSTVLSVCYQMRYSDWFFLSAVQKLLTEDDFSKLLDKIQTVNENRDHDQREEDDRSSIYEDSHKDLVMGPTTTPL